MNLDKWLEKSSKRLDSIVILDKYTIDVEEDRHLGNRVLDEITLYGDEADYVFVRGLVERW